MFCSRCGTSVQDGSKFCPTCGLDLTAQTPLGRTVTAPQEVTELDMVQQALADEYEIRQELGRGGMAIVFKAREKLLDREVAVKVLPFSLAFDAEFVERFQREARTSAKLEHPSIIPIYRVGKSGRVIYFVMKFLRGSSLSDLIEKKGPLPPAEIRKILVQTASALGYAHRNDIVHRDIKPDNIMFDEMGHAVVTDFGIAKAASGTKLTGTGMSIGTPHYMSPEQAKAQPLDGRSDLYSLGVVAYQCLTGHVPFDGEDAFSIGYKHIMEEVPTPANLPTAEHRKLFGIIRKMMAKAASERFQNADDLVAVLEGRSVPEAEAATMIAPAATEAATVAMPSLRDAPRVPTPAAPRPSTPTTPIPRASVEGRPAPPPKKRSGLLAASIVLLVLGGGGAGGYFYASTNLCPASPNNPVCAMLPGFTPPVVAPVIDTSRRVAAVNPAATADSTAAADSTRVAARDTQPAAPLPPTGILVVTGMPSGARIVVDRGEPSTQVRYELPPGSHRVAVRATGFEDYSRSITIGRGDSIAHVVQMQRVARAEPPRGQCDDPVASTYNLGNVCFDRGPRLQGSPALDVRAVSGDLPATITMYVRVRADGTVERILPGTTRQEVTQRPALSQVLQLAQQYLQQGSFQPATKSDQNVAAWGQVLLRLQR